MAAGADSPLLPSVVAAATGATVPVPSATSRAAEPSAAPLGAVSASIPHPPPPVPSHSQAQQQQLEAQQRQQLASALDALLMSTTQNGGHFFAPSHPYGNGTGNNGDSHTNGVASGNPYGSNGLYGGVNPSLAAFGMSVESPSTPRHGSPSLASGLPPLNGTLGMGALTLPGGMVPAGLTGLPGLTLTHNGLMHHHHPHGTAVASSSSNGNGSGNGASNGTTQTPPTPSPSSRDTPRVEIFGYDLSHKGGFYQFAVVASGLFIMYFFYGVLQEYIFSLEGFSYGWYLTLVQFMIYAVMSMAQMKAESERDRTVVFVRRAPLLQYALIGLLSVATVGLSNVACQYLNYPTQVLFKSCKTIPVMLVGVCYLGKKYSGRDYLSVLLLSAGIVIFSLGSSGGGKDESFSFPWVGVILISFALLADALIGNVQEKVLQSYDASATEMIYYTKLIGLGYISVVLLGTGELWPAFWFCLAHPTTYVYMSLFAIVGCIGEHCVMVLLKRFGALIAVITTSSRKFLTMVMSFVLFPKPFTFAYLVGMAMVFSGMGLEIWIKNEKAILQWWQTYRSADKKQDVVGAKSDRSDEAV